MIPISSLVLIVSPSYMELLGRSLVLEPPDRWWSLLRWCFCWFRSLQRQPWFIKKGELTPLVPSFFKGALIWGFQVVDLNNQLLQFVHAATFQCARQPQEYWWMTSYRIFSLYPKGEAPFFSYSRHRILLNSSLRTTDPIHSILIKLVISSHSHGVKKIIFYLCWNDKAIADLTLLKKETTF